MNKRASLSDREAASRAVPLIDLTSLGEDDNEAGIDRLCERAAAAGVAAVCVWPQFVARCRDRLDRTGISVATVVNFPLGDGDTTGAVRETKTAIESGAEEIDLVLPYRRWLRGDRKAATEMVAAVRAACGSDLMLKVILETGCLAEAEYIRNAALDAVAAGADFLKTSTGKSRVSATPRAARILLEVIRSAPRAVGLKAAGGIRTVRQAANYLRLADDVMGRDWVVPRSFRFGASSLLDDCERMLNS